ncbi:hypothetical protein [Parvibaculum sp.]|jgi:uncharacterized membrane protein|uniref:hypothetical protein n=1 Tax=Parvibaculum sp. TaxID=2024848 RepID=UPI000C351A45|nr:hypothetical protein [Parvibaculum sp.]MAM94533.1 hypothetical protein [Parvibaculum sp.]HCX68791.1 hypothetical protein [Rhodobiaceae bacterium]|tara:strand:- start:41914 stop:42186 length:273 start_codon:yes stop_codon:yes gene_type:complete
MSAISEMTQRKWERRLRSFWIVGGLVFFGGILVARPLTESFEAMRWFIPFAIVSLFSALAISGLIWLMLQIALAHRERDEAVRSRPAGVR